MKIELLGFEGGMNGHHRHKAIVKKINEIVEKIEEIEDRLPELSTEHYPIKPLNTEQPSDPDENEHIEKGGEQPSQEAPIDCNCVGIDMISNQQYCGKCGGYLPNHPKHKSNWKPAPLSPDKGLEEIVKVLDEFFGNIRPHQSCQFVDLPNGYNGISVRFTKYDLAKAILTHLEGVVK